MGGTSGGGGSSTQNTNYNMKNWEEYIPWEARSAYGWGYQPIKSRVGQGLTPEEKATYTGQITSGVGRAFQGAEKSLLGSLARSGVSGPDTTEALSNLKRNQAESLATGLSTLPQLDVKQKQQNIENLLNYVKIPSTPISIGGTSTTSYSGGGGGS